MAGKYDQLKKLADGGADIPLINDPPETNFVLNFYVNAYWFLCRFRNEKGSIPLDQVYSWFKINNVNEEDYDEFLTYIYALNDVHTEHDNLKLKQELERKK